MKLRESVLPYLVQEIDYTSLQRAIKQAFVDEYGAQIIKDVRVAHYNPDVIDATVSVQSREPDMDDTAMALGELFRRDGLRVAIRVTELS